MIARLLGTKTEGETSTANSTLNAPAAATSSGAPNRVMMFLCQREEPKAISIKSDAVSQQQPLQQKHQQVNSNIDLRRMHHASGYDPSNYEKRNWTEIYQHIKYEIVTVCNVSTILLKTPKWRLLVYFSFEKKNWRPLPEL